MKEMYGKFFGELIL